MTFKTPMKYRLVCIGPRGRKITTKWYHWERVAAFAGRMKLQRPDYRIELDWRAGRFTRRRNLRAWYLRWMRQTAQSWARARAWSRVEIW